MKRTTHNTLIRVPLNKGDYATLSNRILQHNKISSDAKVLLQILLNNAPDWEINLEYYSSRFGWGKEKQAAIIKELKDGGFMIIQKFSKGQGKGFEYRYTISEYGNLSGGISTMETQIIEPQTEITTNEVEVKDDPIEYRQKKIAVDSDSPEFMEFALGVLKSISILLDDNDLPDDYCKKVKDYYTDQMLTGIITKENYDNGQLEQLLLKRIWKQRKEAFNKMLDRKCYSGTKVQINAIRQRVLEWCESKILSGEKVSDKDASARQLLIQASILGANRNLPDVMD